MTGSNCETVAGWTDHLMMTFEPHKTNSCTAHKPAFFTFSLWRSDSEVWDLAWARTSKISASVSRAQHTPDIIRVCLQRIDRSLDRWETHICSDQTPKGANPGLAFTGYTNTATNKKHQQCVLKPNSDTISDRLSGQWRPDSCDSAVWCLFSDKSSRSCTASKTTCSSGSIMKSYLITAFANPNNIAWWMRLYWCPPGRPWDETHNEVLKSQAAIKS